MENETPADYKKWSEKDFQNSIAQYKDQYVRRMLIDFYNHFSEPNAKGKMRFQLEKTWHTGKRLAKWRSNNYGKYERDEQQANQAINGNTSMPSTNFKGNATAKRDDANSRARKILGIQ